MLQHLDSEFLRGLPPRALPLMSNLLTERQYSAGSVLFLEGATHSQFHIVLTGQVRLDMQVPQRGRIPIMTTGPGDVLAWSALIGQGHMTATATALVPVRTAACDGEQLRELCDQQPDIGYLLMRQLATALSRRLVATRLQLLDLFAGHVPVLESPPVFGKPGDPEC